MGKYKAGVLFGKELEALYNDAKDNQFAMPAVNCMQPVGALVVKWAIRK